MSQTVNTAKRPGLTHLDLMVMAAYDIISNVRAKSCYGLEPWHDLGKAGLLAVRKFFGVILLAIALKSVYSECK